MKRGVLAILLIAIALSAFAAELRQNEEWKLLKQNRSVTIYGRPHEGSREGIQGDW
jgi:hypothetical protein